MFHAAGILFRFSAWIGVLPYSWDCTNHRVILYLHSHFFIRIHLFHSSLTLFCYFLLSLNFYLDSSFKNFNLSVSFTLTIALILQVWIMMIFREQESFTSCNSILSYLEHMHQNYLPNYNPNSARFSLILDIIALLICTSFGVGCLITCACVPIPTFPHVPWVRHS